MESFLDREVFLMLNNVIPLHDDSRDCFEDQITTVASWFGRGYELMYAESWGFSYSPADGDSSGILGKRIGAGRTRENALRLLELYHGIRFTWHQTNTIDEVLPILKAELAAGRPVIIYLDSYWCPWAPSSYQKIQNSHHNCIVVGLDEVNGFLYCTDGYYVEQNKTLPLEYYAQGCGRCGTFTLIGDEAPIIDWREIIKSSAELILGSNSFPNAFDAMRTFGRDAALIDLAAEIEGCPNIWRSPLWMQLDNIHKGRKQFSKVLRYMAEQYDVAELLVLSRQVEQVGGLWSIIQTMLYKAHIKNNSSAILCRIPEKINEVADEEERIANALISLSLQNTTTSIADFLRTNKAQIIPEETICIDLSDYLNNNGFGSSMSNDCTADLLGTGQYFLIEGLPETHEWQIGGMKFRFPRVADKANDNISCTGQNIRVPIGRYYYIMLMGCAECGNFSKNMTVEYSDGTSDSILIEFSDWHSLPYFGESIAWSGKSVLHLKDNIMLMPYQAHLFVQTYSLNHDKILESIHLPDFPNIHVFAISLVR
jgi:hypothetical protein